MGRTFSLIMTPRNDGGMARASSEFEQAASDLYALAPQDFVAARDERAARARESGDDDLAAQIRALRRPTQGAWLVNLLWRHHRDSVEALLGLGDELRQAQRRLSGEQLRELSAQRHRVVGALVAQARRLASGAGVRVTADTAREVEDTLNAALASDDAAEQVRSGRLVKPVSYAGFGPQVSLTGPSAEPGLRAAPPEPATAAGAAQAGKAVEAAREAVEEAERALDDARRQLAERAAALEAALRQRDELRERLAGLREQVRDLERRSAAAELDMRAETRKHQQAEAAEEVARRRLDRAEERLRRLER
jgi:superfamily II RNA helicase